jgi:hypothetical protein
MSERSAIVQARGRVAHIYFLIVEPRFEVVIDSLIRDSAKKCHIPYTSLLLLSQPLRPIRLEVSLTRAEVCQLTLATLLVAPPPPPDKSPPAFFPAFFEIAFQLADFESGAGMSLPLCLFTARAQCLP